jgi:hypothetical protein
MQNMGGVVPSWRLPSQLGQGRGAALGVGMAAAAAAGEKKKKGNNRLVADNREARFNYEVIFAMQN